jgi:sulfide:quinone oxidoreductase
MPKVLILGAGVAGHTAAMHAKRMLGKKAEITVVTPNSKWNWMPSNIWKNDCQAGHLPFGSCLQAQEN